VNAEVAIVAIAALVLIGLFLVKTYDRLVTLKQRVNEAWSDIEVQLTRRHELVAELVGTVRGHVGHERDTLEGVTRARQQAVEVRGLGPSQRAQPENVLGDALRRLFALAEQYPQLRAVEPFTRLRTELSAVEENIAFAKRFYNGNVRDHNTALLAFPTNLIAGMFGSRQERYFEIADDVERGAPQVRFT